MLRKPVSCWRTLRRATRNAPQTAILSCGRTPNNHGDRVLIAQDPKLAIGHEWDLAVKRQLLRDDQPTFRWSRWAFLIRRQKSAAWGRTSSRSNVRDDLRVWVAGKHNSTLFFLQGVLNQDCLSRPPKKENMPAIQTIS